MNIFMLIADSMIIVVLLGSLQSTMSFMRKAKVNVHEHKGDQVAEMHFHEHTIAAFFTMLGAAMGVALAAIHAVLHNVIHAPMPEWFEYACYMTIAVYSVGCWLSQNHMNKEETKGHPFYVREYGEG